MGRLGGILQGGSGHIVGHDDFHTFHQRLHVDACEHHSNQQHYSTTNPIQTLDTRFRNTTRTKENTTGNDLFFSSVFVLSKMNNTFVAADSVTTLRRSSLT